MSVPSTPFTCLEIFGSPRSPTCSTNPWGDEYPIQQQQLNAPFVSITSILINHLIEIKQKYPRIKRADGFEFWDNVYKHNVDIWGLMMPLYTILQRMRRLEVRLPIPEKRLAETLYLMVLAPGSQANILDIEKLKKYLRSLDSLILMSDKYT
jgi:hypothetical protein